MVCAHGVHHCGFAIYNRTCLPDIDGEAQHSRDEQWVWLDLLLRERVHHLSALLLRLFSRHARLSERYVNGAYRNRMELYVPISVGVDDTPCRRVVSTRSSRV